MCGYKVHGLNLPSGIWCNDDNILKDEVVKYFKELLSRDGEVRVGSDGDCRTRLSDDARRVLTKPISKIEVYEALMSMKSYKAPGPAGFQRIFFKMFWNDVGDDLWHLVKNAFEMGSFDVATTDTLLVLIPKGDHPTSFTNFRPISLCNVTYKIIAKVLVTRLRPFLNDIISPLQSSFISGRSTKDNAIILQKIIYHMNKKRKKKGDVVFKLDLEKAYDRVDWGFLKQTLIMFGFPTYIISLIMHSLASTLISLLWNGSKTESFTPSRGLRQGDPLSPYLFVLCMERLGEMIQEEVRVGRWLPLQVSANGPTISHLFFVDDVLLFAKSKPSKARVINKILDDFCSISGLKVSLDKSRVKVRKTTRRGG